MSKGYVPRALRERVAAQARRRCGYCLTQEAIVGATASALDLNRPSLVAARRAWIRAGWHPPEH